MWWGRGVEYKAQLMREQAETRPGQRSGVGAHTNFMYTLFYVDAYTHMYTYT